MLARIAEAAAAPGDTVVEIGPGRGELTKHLLGVAGRVVAVEIDPHLAAALPRQCGSSASLTVIVDDILKVDLATLSVEFEQNQCVIVGNLPYYITSPILRAVFAAHGSFRSATFLMQAEVADRVAATGGSRAFGFLSCLCQLHSEPRTLFTVSPGAFSPPPEVQSAVVQFTLGKDPPADALVAFVSACFRHPRKTLKNNLSGLYPLARLASDPLAGLRAQQLAIADLQAMWERLEEA